MIGELLLDYLIAAADDSPSWMQDITGGVFDRRTLFKRGFTALTLLRATRASASTAPDSTSALDDLTYAEWYERNIPAAKGKEFEHPLYPQSDVIEQKHKDLLIRIVESLDGISFDIDSGIYSQKHVCTAVDAEDHVIEEFATRSNNALEELIEFIGGITTLPEFHYRPLTEDGSFVSSNSRIIGLNLVYSRSINIQATYPVIIPKYTMGRNPIPGGQSMSFRIKVPDNRSSAERAHGYRIHSEEGVQISQPDHSPIILTVGRGKVMAYSSAPIELMHTTIGNYTRNHLKKELQQWWIKNGRPTQLDPQEGERAINKCRFREEALVHGVFYEFLERKREELGFSVDEVNTNYQGRIERATYAGVPYIRQKVRELGPGRVVVLYAQNPDSLFSGLR